MEIQTSSVEDSDDEGLPDLFPTKNCTNNEENYEIRPGDIVWAEFRQLYWPSLVRCVYKKDKKASVWYLDSPRKTFKVPFKKIKCFSDSKINASIRAEVNKSPMKTKALHDRVFIDAMTYIRRQADGHEDDPAAYFDQSQHYFSFKDFKLDCKSQVNDDTNAAEPLKCETSFNSNCSEEESLIGSDDDEDFAVTKKISRFLDLDDSEEDKAKTDAIVQCITAGHTDKHLLRIKAKKTPSKYQTVFEDAMKTDRKKLFDITACDIVKSLKKLREISFYLMNFYERVVEGGKCEMVDYITSVWLPEAINKANELINEGIPVLCKSNLRRKLFPTDKLVNGEVPDFITVALGSEKNINDSKKSSVLKIADKKHQQTKTSFGKKKNNSPTKSTPKKRLKKK